MLQTTFCVPLDVKPESTDTLRLLIDEFRDLEDQSIGKSGVNFGRILDGIPTLHFMSMSIFEDQAYDPIFVVEVNCDGPAGPVWAHLEVLAADTLRDMLRCCKSPLDKRRALYEAVTAADSTAPVGPYFEAMTQEPSVFHHGNRGLTRDRILREAELFRAIRSELDRPEDNPYFAMTPGDLHRSIRDRMLAEFPWLKKDPQERISGAQKFGDFRRLLGYVALVLLILSLPGLLAVMLLPDGLYFGGVAIFAAVIWYFLKELNPPLEDTEVTSSFSLISVLKRGPALLVAIVLVPLAVLVIVCWSVVSLYGQFYDLGETWMRVVFWDVVKAYFFATWLVVLPGLVLWLRGLELNDSSQYAANIDPVKVAEMARHEDWVSQNHMGSVVHIRPGVLRTLIVKFGHRGLGYLLRVTARDGRLGSMRTVHFAHWAFLNNSGRLLFVSNFDQSWGSYLDDFIEKAHVGLTLAWGCGVGFPPTRFLIYDGASHGRLFKNWALASRTVSRFWISAYPDLSVDQIERNFRIAEKLHEPRLSKDDAEIWMRDL